MDFAIPAINIVFLLLLFFITGGSQINRAEQAVPPPTAELLPGERLPRPLLTVTASNELFLDGAPMDEARIAALIGGRRSSDAGAFPTLNVLADRDMPASELLGLMARLRQATPIALKLVTRRPDAPAPVP